MNESALGGDVLIAVPKKGRVYDSVVAMLKDTGLEYNRSPRLDFAKCKTFPNTTILFLPCSDIPQYLDRGNVDIGITGQDMIAESNASVKTELALGFGQCSLCVLGPAGKFRSVRELQGATIGTSFPNVTKRFFGSQGIDVRIQVISGSVEIACPLGLADAVVDLVETGTTMRAAGLEVVDTIFKTEMVLASNTHSRHKEEISQIVRRIEGYSIARDWVLMTYNLPKHLVPEATLITPGMSSPSVVNLDCEGMVALSAMVPRQGSANKIDQLSAMGATGIFVTELKHYRPGEYFSISSL
jgi:ATP phosphoribosyltransferase